MFDRWAILTAYAVYAHDWNGERYTNSIGVRLSRLKFRASDSEQTLEGLSPEAKAIYGSLVRRHHGKHVAYERLHRKHPEVFPSWPGTANVRSSGNPYRAFVRAQGLDDSCLDCWS